MTFLIDFARVGRTSWGQRTGAWNADAYKGRAMSYPHISIIRIFTIATFLHASRPLTIDEKVN